MVCGLFIYSNVKVHWPWSFRCLRQCLFSMKMIIVIVTGLQSTLSSATVLTLYSSFCTHLHPQGANDVLPLSQVKGLALRHEKQCAQSHTIHLRLYVEFDPGFI